MSKTIKRFVVVAVSFIFTFTFAAAVSAQETAQPDAANLNPKKAENSSGGTNSRQIKRQASGGGNPENRGGLVISAYLGAARTARTDLTISQPGLNTQLTFKDVKLASRSFESPQYYGIRAGYFFRRAPHLGAEVELIHLKVYSDPEQRVQASGVHRGTSLNREIRLGDIVQQYSISHGVNLLLFNLAARRGFSGGSSSSARKRLFLTARGGAGLSVPHTESRIDNQSREQYETGRFSWQLAGSAELRLVRGLYLLGEYKYTESRQKGKIFMGSAESYLRTHHGVFGLSYHF